LGYPATMGADFIQYIVADRQLIPPELASYYREKVIYLPHGWVTSPIEVPEPTTTRADWGLPTDRTVFCCFNGIYKIDPIVFGVWMEILRAVPDSVLWLSDGGQPIIVDRLRQRAVERGVNPDRVIFAKNLPYQEYVSRYRLADLFLDTFVYNAGGTAVDAFQAGLPVLTCPGQSYVARMGASLCTAIGMPELICDSPTTYRDRAIALGNHPDRLQALKAKLAEALTVSPLFQPQVFVRQFETALRQILADRF
jgi:protein O-GlcNAc transferase